MPDGAYYTHHFINATCPVCDHGVTFLVDSRGNGATTCERCMSALWYNPAEGVIT